MALDRMWLGMVTRNGEYSGTDSPIVLIVNQDSTGETERLHYTFPATAQEDQERGGANLYEVDLTDALSISPDELTNSSVRVGIRGADLWEPEHLVIWGVDADSQDVLAVAAATNIDTRLSTDQREGNISLPLRRVRTGDDDRTIAGMLMLMTTADRKWAGTDSPIELQLNVDGAIKVQFEFPDTPQKDQERAQANMYFVQVTNTFTRGELKAQPDRERVITLTIKGTDKWRPESFFLFGLSTRITERILDMVPLVHEPSWPHGWMSTDSGEGVATVRLNIV